MTVVKVPSLKNTDSRLFKSSRVSDQKQMKVDKENGIIRDVVIAQVGPAEGHGTNVEQQFINGLVDQGNTFKQGVKSRFGHPSMSAEALGTYAGRAFNFRVQGIQALADLHLDPVTANSPKGNIYNYLIDMADKNPDMFGMSVVTSGNWLYQKDEEGNIYTEMDPDWNSKYDPAKPLYEMFENYHAVDFVDEGALTPNGLFSAEINKDKFAVTATTFLDSNPAIDKFLKEHPEKIIEFMSKRFGFNISLQDKEGFVSFMKNLLFKSNTNPMTKPIAKFDINAVTTDGAELLVKTNNDAATVGDEVQNADGTPAADGDYQIKDGDLEGQTLTVQGGKITAITPSAEGTGEGENNTGMSSASTQELFNKLASLESKFNTLAEENTRLKEELAKRPKSAFARVVKPSDGMNGNTSADNRKNVAEYNKKAQDLWDKNNPKK
jgi:hypothetical protein